MAETELSFIETINQVRDKLPAIQEASDLLDADNVAKLEELSEMDTALLIADLRKGNYLGNRKIDINLSLNMIGIEDTTDEDVAEGIWTDSNKTVSYDSAKVTFVDGVVVDVSFLVDENPVNISTHADLLIQLNNHAGFLAKAEQTLWKGIAHNVVGEFVRFYDVIGQNSNIERIELNAVSGAYKEQKPVYYWAKTTSAFQTLAMRAGDIIKLGNDIDSIILLANSIEQILELQDRIPELVDTYTDGVANGDVTIFNKLTELTELHTELSKLIELHNDIKEGGTGFIETVGADLQLGENSEIKTLNANQDSINTAVTNIEVIKNATNHAQIATEKANEAEQSAQLATDKANTIIGLNGEQIVNTLIAGSPATVAYNSTSGKLTFNIPQGPKGPKGESFNSDERGTLANRSIYDGQGEGFSYLATDVTPSTIYFKASDADADWDGGSPFGQGREGEQGISVVDIVFVSSTDPSGLEGKAGATDTYKFLLSNAQHTNTFTKYNGQDGAVLSVSGKTGNISLKIEDIVGLSSEILNLANELSVKQDVLISGTNIKTINEESLLGDGNLKISTGTKLLFEKSLFGGL